MLVVPLWIFDWGPSNASLPIRDQAIPIDITNNKRKVPMLPPLPTPAVTSIKNITIGTGDTLLYILDQSGLTQATAHKAILVLSKIYNPRHLKVGETVELVYEHTTNTTSGQRHQTLKQITIRPDLEKEFILYQVRPGEFISKYIKKKLKSKLMNVSGRIENSLYLTAVQRGLPIPILMDLVRIYSWDIDFQRSIRKGDRFDVLYEHQTTEAGQIVRYGKILYANIHLGNDPKPLYYYKNSKGRANYYDAKGHSAKKALMRTPINGARLSSGFGSRRHPILGYNKMHRGVDFAAPIGTPIFAAGSGVVVYRSKNKAYGNYIRIRHNSMYSTAYGHLSRFKNSVTRGSRVRQGQVIGYVGSTGRSTGPHLHYEILIRGRQTNPMRVKMLPGKQLKGAELIKFKNLRYQVDQKISTLFNTNKINTATR
jgi:murein DD-endopeptidase MepM/ murein hydrolase activator NlpD